MPLHIHPFCSWMKFHYFKADPLFPRYLIVLVFFRLFVRLLVCNKVLHVSITHRQIDLNCSLRFFLLFRIFANKITVIE